MGRVDGRQVQNYCIEPGQRDVLKVRYRMTCRTTTNFIHMFNYNNKKFIKKNNFNSSRWLFSILPHDYIIYPKRSPAAIYAGVGDQTHGGNIVKHFGDWHIMSLFAVNPMSPRSTPSGSRQWWEQLSPEMQVGLPAPWWNCVAIGIIVPV